MHNDIILTLLDRHGAAVPYLGLEIMRVVVSVLRVHWLLFQAFAHVAGIFISDAGNSLTGCSAPGLLPLKPLFLTVLMTDEAFETSLPSTAH